MASVIEICNKALTLLSYEPIITLDDTSRAARLCSAEFESTLESMLRSFPWSFAVRRASLAKLAEAPAYGFSAYFALPTDFVRLLEIYPTGASYSIEGRKLLISADTIFIKYVSRDIDPNDMDPLFREALALKLASALCMSLTQSEQTRQSCEALYRSRLSEARMAQSQESDATTVTEGDWLTGRII